MIKMKVEVETSNGLFIGISPKCYLIGDNSVKRTFGDKICAKGVKKDVRLERDQYLTSLYKIENDERDVSEYFVFDKKIQKVVSKQQEKKLINNIYLKFSVSNNLVELTPLKKNNSYL